MFNPKSNKLFYPLTTQYENFAYYKMPILLSAHIFTQRILNTYTIYWLARSLHICLCLSELTSSRRDAKDRFISRIRRVYVYASLTHAAATPTVWPYGTASRGLSNETNNKLFVTIKPQSHAPSRQAQPNDACTCPAAEAEALAAAAAKPVRICGFKLKKRKREKEKQKWE